MDEAGTVRIDRPQPQAERPLEAGLSDDDGVTTERWRWARSGDGATWTDIEGAASHRRSPTAADVDMYLRATVTYSDRFGSGKTSSAVTPNRVEAKTLSNAAPSFVDPNGDEVTTLSRSVAENSAVGSPVGRPVSATDPDEDVLFYELLDTPDMGDEEGARFTIDSLSGQIRVDKVLGADTGEREDEDSTNLSGVPALPADEDADDADNSEYVLRVRVSDPSTASVTVNVIVTVADVNEPPAFDDDVPILLRVRERENPLVFRFGDGDTQITASTFQVTDQDSADTSVSYTLSGADHSAFTIIGGDLAFKSTHRPNFEYRSSYSITITARSGDGARGLSTTLDVTIEVVDTDDPERWPCPSGSPRWASQYMPRPPTPTAA